MGFVEAAGFWLQDHEAVDEPWGLLTKAVRRLTARSRAPGLPSPVFSFLCPLWGCSLHPWESVRVVLTPYYDESSVALHDLRMGWAL